jgi:class 3 adenylate cyclase
VNTASRIESATKGSGYPLMITQAVMDQVDLPVEFDFLGERPLKGRAPMAVYGWPKRPSDLPSTGVTI